MQSVVSYPERGKGGNNKYRGNCSPLLIKDLAHFYKVNSISDYMVGSGTTHDVGLQLGIPTYCYDLHSGFNLLTDDIPERNEFIFWHPPYHNMIQYSDNMYSAKEVHKKFGYDPNQYDLSQCADWEEFVSKLNYCMMKQFASLEKGGHMAVLMGDLKQRGKLFSMLLDIVKPGTVENVIIKMQHNCFSDSTCYAGTFIKIVHEYVLIIRKDSGLIYDLKLTRNYKNDIRDLKAVTWKDVVASVLEETAYRQASLNEIYRAVDGHEKTKNNHFWKEKIRQTLGAYKNIFVPVEKGVWKLAR